MAYVKKVRGAVTRQDGHQLASLLDLKQIQATKQQEENNVLHKTPQPYNEIVSAHLRCGRLLFQKKYDAAYTEVSSCVPVFLEQVFRTEEETWVVPPLLMIVTNVRRVAFASGSTSTLESAGNVLMSCFAAANRPQGDPDKRLATLRIVNELFRIYFKLNTLRNCKYLIRVVEAKKFVAFHLFQAGERVTYKFFVGRLDVFDENFVDADEHLTYAFNHCHSKATKNRRLILKYLVPVKILVGKLPSEKLLNSFEDLHGMYANVKEAVKTGSIKLFEKTLEDHMEDYVGAGTYLLIEKLRFAVYRRLLKKVQLIYAEFRPERAVQVPLTYFVKALKWQGYDTDLAEVECIVANMIYRKYVKGYISHKNGVVVLSKKQPFPPLNSGMLVDPDT